MSQIASTRSTEAEPTTVPGRPEWLAWARRLQAIAQNGITYGNDPFDLERYRAIQAVAAEIIGGMSGAEVAPVHGLLARETGPSTPKIDVRGAVLRDGRILLVRERADGLWTLPGGWVDVEESPSQAIEREVLEESGLRCRADRILAVWDKNRHGHPPSLYHVYKLVFLCRLRGGEPRPGLETAAVDFFAPGNLPSLSTERITAAQIARLFTIAGEPGRATEFD